MPELPEIEALRRYLLREGLVGRTIVEVDADWPGVMDTVDGMGGLSGLVGHRFEGIERRGKQLILPLAKVDAEIPITPALSSDGDRVQNERHIEGVLGLHMEMTGRLGIMDPEDESFRYRRLSLYLDDERRLELDDMRRWASVRLEKNAEVFTSGMGPDALDPGFTAAEFTERVSVRRSPIKSVLLDQKVLAGVGNIYADEALLIVGISPSRRADRISATKLEALQETIAGVLENALAFIESHPDEHGRPYVIDAQDDRMQIPRKAGAPCPQCGSALRAKKFGGRTAYYCPSCQH
ncbi:MAG: Fpg/Nei family DNA glycosylase [Chloroflexi bacterium]|jgi:formamidopyrimidine-DNA glycosylase|nr:Fpg/Nei family DNA glycosylase [Chloroflexota bacterium]MBT4514954.1 Fpg/Nei family DNA glycosylase [Chloroflexota bacterium]MBT6681025.1 Fpg/Nei family DNA glycosylase [Chloroflexota bacterium]